ncbi:hypothetical protein E2C01_060268 [Portunus trituberculatus]|uniref:Reverse transcriptase domain-containing protein n=1 Tax=Portunus trituberculatus TaxID=210409 RepID=A0A5B7H7K7_PORTR|nr:hypothetical protein [Portunus trituberculatus]
MAPVSAWAHQHGIFLLRYLDDWLITGSSRQECTSAIQAISHLCDRLDIQVNLSKSDLVPSQRKQYLGMVLDSKRALIFPSPEWIGQFRSVARSFLEDKAPPMSLWRSLLGHLASLERLVPVGRLHSRSLQWCLKRHWRAASDPPWWRVPPSHQCLADLFWPPMSPFV